MRLLYQMMLAFFTSLIIMLAIVGLSFTYFVYQGTVQSTFDDMEKDGQTALARAMVVDQQNKNYALSEERVVNVSAPYLENDGIKATIYDQHYRAFYPNQHVQSMPKKVIKKIKGSQTESYRIRQRRGDADRLTTYVNYAGKDGHLIGAMKLTKTVKRSDIPFYNVLPSQIAVAGGVALVVSMLAADIFSQLMTKRINRVRRATEAIVNADYQTNLPTGFGDEISLLSADINHMSAELKAQQQQIDEQEERRQQLLANASHEMRTPLTTISGVLEGLEAGIVPDENREQTYQLMKNETERLSRLVNDNLTFERLRQKSEQLNLTKVNLKALLTEVVDQLQMRAREANDTLSVEAPEKLTASIDRDRIEQVLINLISNAIQFTQDGTIKVSAHQRGKFVDIYIADSGIGMSEKDANSIFERYYKADQSRTRSKGESGLGLAITKQIVQAHQGTISVTSELGKGTTFVVELPKK